MLVDTSIQRDGVVVAEELDVGYHTAPIDCNCLDGGGLFFKHKKASTTSINANIGMINGLVGW